MPRAWRCRRGILRSALLAFAVVVGGTQACVACNLIYPEDYVPPTPAELVARSDVALVGRVVAYRFDDGSLLEHDITCEGLGNEAFHACWDQRVRIVTAILSVEFPIRGIGGQPLFEDVTSAEGGADCGNQYDEGELYLVTDYLATQLTEVPDAEEIALWRSLPFAERQP